MSLTDQTDGRIGDKATSASPDREAGLVEAITRAWGPFGPGDYVASLGLWRIVARDYPWHMAGHIGVTLCHIRMGQFDVAEDLLRLLIRLDPEQPDVLALRPQVTAGRGDLPTAFAEWKVLRERFPQHVAIKEHYLKAQWHLRLHHLDAENAHVPVDVVKVQDPQARSLVMQFESLGDNCELGLVQRHFEAEPLGLLRWSFARPSMIAKLLESRLAGVGDFDNTEIGKFENGEYWLRDTLYGIGPFHTFISGSTIEPDILHRDHSRRMRRLRERLLEDLTEGHKIFVYKATLPIEDDEVQRIHRAIRAYGPNKLMVVQSADETNPAGSVRYKNDGLVFGFLSFTSPQSARQGGVWNIPYDEWVSICRGALEVVT